MHSRLLPLFVIPLLLAGPAHAKPQPNLLFLYIDDLGWRDVGFMGSDFYETPYLDELAASGMIFTNAYSGAANCAPARACLMSGQYSPRHQIFNVGTNPRGKRELRLVDHVPGKDTLDPSLVTWAECLQQSGYETAIMGKWHLSNDPIAYGFDLNRGGSHSGSPPRGYFPPHPQVPGLAPLPSDEYLTDTLNREAAAFIRRQKEKPWMLYLSHFSVHTPLQAKPHLVEKYRKKKPGQLHDHAVMAAMIETLDSGIGDIVKALEESRTREDTIIIFTSDNGGYGPATDMAPLKGYKGTYYEGGIRVPLFVIWPGVIANGQTCETPVTGVDFYPTICEMLDVSLPSDQILDGESLVPILRDQSISATERSLFWHFPAYLQSYSGVNDEQRDPLFRSRPCSVIRRGDWKMIEYLEDGALELFDLKKDPGESENLEGIEKAKADELLRRLRDWRANSKAPIPKRLP